MSERVSSNSRMLKDTVLYMFAKAIEGIVGIVTISVLTYLFAKADYGRYTLWNITATTFAMLSIQWLSQSAGRYLHEYEIKGGAQPFYSTVFSSWLTVNLCAAVIAVFGGLLLSGLDAGTVPGFMSFMYGDGFATLFTLTVSYFITYNTSQLLIALLSVRRKAITNLIISVFSSIGKLVLILALSRLLGSKISIIFLSYIICDLIVIIFAVAALSVYTYIKPKSKSKSLQKEFGRYGAPLVGNLATTTVLNNSDRFIIQNYMGEDSVGLYTTSYSIVSSVFTMLQTALMRGSYPTILKTYAEGKKELTEKLISHAVRNYLIVAVPSVAGLGVLAQPLASLLFAPEYVPGYRVMAWAALGMLFLGLTEYSNKPWELSAKTVYIFKNSLIGGIVNLTLNIVFIPYIGYMTAAYSTFIGFFIYFCLSKYGSRKLMRWRLSPKTYASIIISSVIMGACLYFGKSTLGVTKATLIIYVMAGVLIYGACLTVSGEINEEIQMLKSYISNKRKIPR